MTQQALLLETLELKRKPLYKYALKISSKPEMADDIMQHLVIRILQGSFNFEIETPYRFLHHMIKQVYFNQYRTNKKYIFQENIEVTQTEFFDRVMFEGEYCTYQEDLVDSFSLRDIKRLAMALPKKQRQAIMTSLDGEPIGSTEESNYESKKTNRRIAMLKLKELLGG